MKSKGWIRSVLAGFMVLSLAGCQLAQEGKETADIEDRLIGVFITTEHLDLFDMEGYLNDNLPGIVNGEIMADDNSGKYQDRLYAKLEEKTLTSEETGEETTIEEYVFEGVEGIRYFAAEMEDKENQEPYTSTSADDSISGGHVGIFNGDEEDKITLEGTIYYTHQYSNSTFYMNPVYQSRDGSVYAMGGNGIMTQGIEGERAKSTMSLESSTTRTENGKSKKQSASVKITFAAAYPPEKILVWQMDERHQILSGEEYMPGKMPETISPELETAYLIVETFQKAADGTTQIERELYGKEEETVTTRNCLENGICEEVYTQLVWE